jgi:hypothetical protein
MGGSGCIGPGGGVWGRLASGEEPLPPPIGKEAGSNPEPVCDMEKRKCLPLPRLELELRPFGRPARSQALHRLNHRVIGTIFDGSTLCIFQDNSWTMPSSGMFRRNFGET